MYFPPIILKPKNESLYISKHKDLIPGQEEVPLHAWALQSTLSPGLSFSS